MPQVISTFCLVQAARMPMSDLEREAQPSLGPRGCVTGRRILWALIINFWFSWLGPLIMASLLLSGATAEIGAYWYMAFTMHAHLITTPIFIGVWWRKWMINGHLGDGREDGEAKMTMRVAFTML